ncbi:unnamed protein product [Prunus armeniaca]
MDAESFMAIFFGWSLDRDPWYEHVLKSSSETNESESSFEFFEHEKLFSSFREFLPSTRGFMPSVHILRLGLSRYGSDMLSCALASVHIALGLLRVMTLAEYLLDYVQLYPPPLTPFKIPSKMLTWQGHYGKSTHVGQLLSVANILCGVWSMVQF